MYSALQCAPISYSNFFSNFFIFSVLFLHEEAASYTPVVGRFAGDGRSGHAAWNTVDIKLWSELVNQWRASCIKLLRTTHNSDEWPTAQTTTHNSDEWPTAQTTTHNSDEWPTAQTTTHNSDEWPTAQTAVHNKSWCLHFIEIQSTDVYILDMPYWPSM